jgi:glycine cleavage system H lipoate-binding protein
VDDFAAKVAGKAERIDAPTRGQWVRQGQKILSFHRDGRQVNLVSPIEGTVVGVNEKALENPELARKDPYGEGWLLEIHSPDAKTNFRNLFGGALARRWMEETAARLRALSPAFAGAYAQDGGVAVDDAFAHLSEADWETAQTEFFLTK